MNERRTKSWFGERGSIGRPLFGRLFSLSRRSVPSALLLLAFAFLPCARVDGYTKMENDRILLMNNDSKTLADVSCQGYDDTNTNKKTHWVHTGPKVLNSKPIKYLLAGTNHVMYAQDGTKYWELENCRAGSASVISEARNYIPWSSTAEPITNVTWQTIKVKKNIPCTDDGAGSVGSVVMRNIADACVYSPYYKEGIGTIYFDAVNSFVNDTSTMLVLEVASNVTASAYADGVRFTSSLDDYGVMEWKVCPFDLFTVMSKTNTSGVATATNVTLVSTAATNVTLASAATGCGLFYRVRSTLNCWGAVRFRIRRVNKASGNIDTAGLVLVDNIIASYPPMTAKLQRYGSDYDASLKGSAVLGTVGDFSNPFLAYRGEGIHAHAFVELYTNTSSKLAAKVNNSRLVYRWRYLNQIKKDWQVLPFDQTSVDSISYTTSNLVTKAEVPLTDGVGDLEYYFVAELDAPYYAVKDYAFATAAGYGAGWTEKISAITNRASYAATDGVPSGGTDYFVRIREGESNKEWVELQGTLSYTNKVDGSNVVEKLLTPDGTVPRMTLVGDHSWRYHYQVPTNAIGGKLSFRLVTKEYYTNDTDATSAAAPEWLVRTNTLYTVEDTVTEIPYTATLEASNPNDISVILDDSSTHLKIEYNDEMRAFSLSHASYQAFNQWTDATQGFRGNVMDGNGVSNSGVSDNKKRYDAPFGESWELCPEQNNYWLESFTKPVVTNTTDYPLDTWFSVHKTPNGWTAHNSRFVEGARAEEANLALSLDGLGEGALALENFSKDDLPLGLDSVQFTARISQPIQFDDFATYMDGLSCSNYAISAMVTMSQQYETATVKPKDMSPVYPSISFVGYHRGKQGCYEFRMTRTGDNEITLGLYRWTRSGSGTKPTLLKSQTYTANKLLPISSDEVNGIKRTAAYFLLYTYPDGTVKLEGHVSSEHTIRGTGVVGTEKNLATPVISFVDDTPGVLARGGSYGVGSTDCRASFDAIRTHTILRAPAVPTGTDPAEINFYGSEAQGQDKLRDEWDYYTSRWEVNSEDATGGLLAVIPSNQVIQVWLSDASVNGSGWDNSGYEVVVNSFSTNTFTVSPRMPGSWKVRLQTGEEEDAGVVVDDVEITPWEGVETWGRKGSAYDVGVSDEWVYTKAWICTSAEITRNTVPYYLPDENVKSVGTNGYVLIFNKPGAYTFTPTTDMEIDRFLVVGGGGAGGDTLGGGGGGGAVLDKTMSVVLSASNSYDIVVGAGGKVVGPLTTSAQPWNAGGDGGESSITINGTKYRSKGGGGGASWSSRSGRSGGSGGGASDGNNNASNGSGGAGTTGSATEGQGYKGGNNYGDRAGGGGGAGAPGQDANATNDKAGDGGDGLPSDITGRVEYYGGGGGGGGGDGDKSPNSTNGGAGGLGGGASGQGKGSQVMAAAGEDGRGGGGAGGAYNGATGTNRGGAGGSGVVILRVRAATRQCVLQPSRGVEGYPMGLRSPYIGEGMSLFTFSYANADSNCVLLVQIATNMLPSSGSSPVASLTESLATNGEEQVWTTVARYDFSTMTNKGQLASGILTTFISLRQHWIYDSWAGSDVYTNVCGAIRVIVDPDIVSKVVNAPKEERDALVDYGRITLTKAYCYNEPALNLQSWFGWNVHTEGWDGAGNAGRFAYLTDWPDGLSIALNFSAKTEENKTTDADTLGIGLGEPEKATEYAGQNPFVQSAALTNGIGTVSFRARLFDTSKDSAVITLYGGTDPAADQPTTESQCWHPLTNFLVTSSTYQAFEWTHNAARSDYQAIRLEAAGARHGRRPSIISGKGAWEWDDLTGTTYGAPVVEPINRVFIDEVSASELIVPRLKFLDVRPFRTNLGTEEICVITNIMSAEQQPLMRESWGFQCRLEPQQMADELDTSTIRVWVEAYRGESPWGYEQWKNLPVDNKTRFSAELQRVSNTNLVFRSYYMIPESIMPPEQTPNTVYQYVMRATYRDKSGSDIEYPAELEASDWVVPYWYRGSDVGKGNASGDPQQFSAYTILDSISPQRGWINEVNNADAMDNEGRYQFIELAVPQNANLDGWHLVVTDFDGKTNAILATIGLDSGVRNLKSKTGERFGEDITNHYTFVSICSPSARSNVKNDGYWKTLNTGDWFSKGNFQFFYPYGIQLVRPSGIIEHEIVVQGTNVSAGTIWGSGLAGTNLLATLRAADPDGQWFYAGEDLVDEGTGGSTLGVFRSHGEDVDPSCWTNYMTRTPAAINQLKDGTRQNVPEGYFLEPLGENMWIYSTLLKPEYMKQFYGGNDMGANAVIVVPKDTVTNIVLVVTNWYQVGSCTSNGREVPGARGQSGTYTLNLGAVTNSMTILIDAEPDDRLKNDFGLTPDNSYSAAVLEWLKDKYNDYGPSDLSRALYCDLSLSPVCPLTLTEMYWLNIPPVHVAPVRGGSNIWYVAGMGTLTDPVPGPARPQTQDVEPHVTYKADGTPVTNVYLTVTMMITNTVTAVAWPPDRLNGREYIDGGSTNWNGNPPWTSVVFAVTGALQKPGKTAVFRPLKQYVFTPSSFGDPADPARRFQTRIEVTDPFSPNSIGDYYGWGSYRYQYQVFYRWIIKSQYDGRVSIVPLRPNWTPPTGVGP